MDEQKYEKAKKNDPIIFLALAIILGVLLTVIFILSLVNQTPLRTSDYFKLITGLLSFILMIIAFIGIRKDKIYGSIAGIIAGILYILQLNIIGIIIGIAMIWDCSRFIAYLNKNKK